MLLLILCCVFVPMYCLENGSESCNGMQFRGQQYEGEIIIDGIEVNGQISIDKRRNLLFFSYSDIDNIVQTAYIDVDAKKLTKIEEITGVMASAVDESDNQVYLAGDEGIYKFDLSNRKAVFIGLKSTSIWSLYAWDRIYFTDFPNNIMYDYNNGNPKAVEALKDNSVKFGVQTSDGVYFVNSSGLFLAVNDFEVKYVYSMDDAYRFIAKDSLNNIFVGRKEVEEEMEVNVDIYMINKKEKNVEKVATVEDAIYGLVFDRDDNIILIEADKIVRYKMNANKMPCLH